MGFVKKSEQHEIFGYVVRCYITYSQTELIKIILAGKIINKSTLNFGQLKKWLDVKERFSRL